MSTSTLERISFERDQPPLRREIRQELGASACTGCPLVALGCPRKSEVAQQCPPEARTIAREEVSAALADDTIGSIFPMSGGGFAILPEMAQQFQTAILAPKAKPKPVVKKKPAVASKQPPRPERRSRHSESGLMAILGELAVIFFGGTPTELAKK